MAPIKTFLREKYRLTAYQAAQISFVCKTLGSELSKLLFMGILFHNYLPYYFFSLFVMLILRCLMGGLHFYTYWGCLASSILYVICAIYVLPNISLPSYLQLITLATSIGICYLIGPVISKYRPDACRKHFKRNINYACKFIFFYALLLYVIPENNYSIIGFWVIILHSIQLLAAKIYERR